MNWYKKKQLLSDKKELKASILSNFPKEKMKKFASMSGSSFNDNTEVPAENQNANFFHVFDIQRYVFDSYAVKTALSKTDSFISISITTNHAFLGTITWDQYWFYELDEMKKAKASYKQINQVVKDTMTKFVDAGGDLPTPMFWAYLKKGCDDIDNESTIRSNIPYVNYANQYRHLSNPDWRSNIYGNRYPKHKEVSFSQYKNEMKSLYGK